MRKRIIKTFLYALIVTVGVSFTAGDSFAVSKPGKVSLTAAKLNQTQVTLKWKKVKGATGYQIYRKAIGKTKYKKIKTCSNKTVTFVNKGLVRGTTYRYIVRAYKTYKVKQYYNKKTKKWQTKRPAKKFIGGSRVVKKAIFGKFSNAKQVKPVKMTKPNAPKTITATNVTDGIKVTVSKVPGANGYRFYRWDSTKGVSVIIKTQASNVYIDKGVTSGKSYQYCVCAYKTYGKTKVFGDSTWQNGLTQRKIPATNTKTTTIASTKANDASTTKATTTVSKTSATVQSVGGTQPTTNYVQTTGGKVYPNSDGTFTVTKGENYTDPVKINGVNNPFRAVYSYFPDGTTFKLNASEFVQESSLGTGSQDGWMGRTAKQYITSISNKSVARIMSCPIDSESAGLSFLASGRTNITFSNGKTMTFIVDGTNTNMNNYVRFVENFVDKNRSLSDYDFVRASLDELRANYTYDGHRDAFLTYTHRGGNCWGGNRLLVRLCVERGIEARELGVTIPNWNAAHRVCVVNIGGVEYVADATPERGFIFTTLARYKQDNATYRFNDTYHEDIPMKW